MNLKGKIYVLINTLCLITLVILFSLSLNAIINWMWSLIPLGVGILFNSSMMLWCLLTIGKIADE